MMKPETDHKRMLLAMFLAAIVLITWQSLVEGPRRHQMAQIAAQKQAEEAQQEKTPVKADAPRENESETTALSRQDRLAASPRVAIASDKLHGSIALKGLRFDDLKLAKYRVTLDESSPEVTLLSPNGDAQSYFIQIGWLSPDGSTRVPTSDTLWQADTTTLSPGETVHFRWDNGQGVTFIVAATLDQDYMFDFTQRVENHSGHPVSVAPYAYINRAYGDTAQHFGIMHEGPLGVMKNTLEEISYEELREKNSISFEGASGWLGITDKYWLTALIPGDSSYKASFSHYAKGNRDRYQADYLGQGVSLADGERAETRLRLFAGAKEIRVLDRYADGDANHPPIPLFDRAVDFGVLYFMTKPMFLTLNFFYTHIGNFGIAIMLLTIAVKLLMYPLANKAYHATSAMREMQPEIMKIRERHKNDHMAINKEMMALYKREKVNPAAGCLPILIQMPVFFALYKVLFVTIEMRHAPFFGWLKDLSAPDPSNLFTLFGLFDWGPPHWLHLGVLPILFTLTMVIQMKQQPKPADPVQAKVMNLMPYFFLFIFAGFPAGLVVYWVWSNTLSILQQQVITRRYHAKIARKKAKAA
jgi:YidC/Oxa1 family membrane protein insertase